jgi:hypothetical protein
LNNVGGQEESEHDSRHCKAHSPQRWMGFCFEEDARVLCLSLPVNISTMSDGVNDDDTFTPNDLENDPIRSFSKFVETFEFSL